MKKLYSIIVIIFLVQIISSAQTTVTNLSAFYRDGQVFVTWDNLSTTGVRYNLYKSSTPIQNGSQLSNAENLGSVRDHSARNLRLTGIFGTRYFKIDSAGTQLASTQGLFVATSTEQGLFYYAVTTTINNVEDTTIQIGINSLQTSIAEMIEMPRPVYQETQSVTGKSFDIYAQFVSKVTSEIYPQMTNEGSYAFHFAICKQGFGLNHSITFYMRPSGNNFLQYAWGIDDPNDWIVTIDDWIPSGQQLATLYYGYHENFDMFIYPNPIPTSGTIYNYTSARVEYTINWCLKNLPVDTTRAYMTGWSMGGIGVMLNMTTVAEKIAAIYVLAPIFNMSISTVATYANQLWGTAGTNLLTNEGSTRNQRLNSCCMVSEKRNTSLPIMFTFCGKNDSNVGWAEKVIFYDSVNTNQHGAFHFWSQTDHFNILTPWSPSYSNFSFFTRYRTNLSYPAFSNCSLNDNPGTGVATDGDSIGTINGYLDWKDNIVDSLERYEITLYVKDLLTTQGALVAPDSGTTDITLRRLQNFSVPTGETIFWENIRNGSLVQQGSFTYDGDLITLPEVKIYKDTSHIKVFYIPVEVADKLMMPSQYALEQNYPNPFNPITTFRYSIPTQSKVVIKVFDILGNEIATLMDEEKPIGIYELTWDATNLPSGVYFYQLKSVDPSTGSGQVYVNTKKMLLLK